MAQNLKEEVKQTGKQVLTLLVVGGSITLVFILLYITSTKKD